MTPILACFLWLQSDSLENLSGALRSDRIEERERAAGEFRKAGVSARPMLEKLTRDKDIEVAKRALLLLRGLDTPPEAFRRVLGTLAESSTARVTVSGSGELAFCTTPGKNAFHFRTTLLLKEGNRVRVNGWRKFEWEGSKKGYELVSDGTRMRGRWTSEKDDQTQEERTATAPGGLGSILAASILLLDNRSFFDSLPRSERRHILCSLAESSGVGH